MKKILLTVAVSTWVVGFLAGCGSAPDPSDAYKNESQHDIYLKGVASLKDKSFSDAIKRFEALDVQYPYGIDTENAQLDLIYAYYMKEDYALATAMADHYIRMHPVSPNADYAYFMRGIANYYQNLGIFERLLSLDLAKRDLKQIKQSYSDFSEVVSHFPNSRYAPAAHQYMIYLRNVLADHELHVGQYYYQRKAYLASANRGADLVAHYQGAPTVKEGLILMAKSYNQLGLTQITRDTMRILQYNYPGTSDDVTKLKVHLDTHN